MRNEAGFDMASAMLNVNPIIVTNPVEVIADNPGTITQIECEAEAFPPPTYNWTQQLGSTTVFVSESSDSGVFEFSPLAFGDEGIYQCFATSNGLTVNSTTTAVSGEYDYKS